MAHDGGFERPDPIDGGPRRGGGGGGFKVIGIVLLVLGVMMVAVCAGGVYWISQNEAMMEGLESITASVDAPGAEELRQAGCTEAMVLDPQVFFRMAGSLSDEIDLDEVETEGLLPDLLVSCTAAGDTTLTCDEVARIYREAVSDPGGPFMTQVASGSSDPCQDVYAADGTHLGTLEEWTSRQLPEETGGEEADAG